MNTVKVYEHDVMSYRYKQDDDILVYRIYVGALGIPNTQLINKLFIFYIFSYYVFCFITFYLTSFKKQIVSEMFL